MPKLANPRWEMYCRTRALKPATPRADAYIGAGYESGRPAARTAACKLEKRPDIQARIAELQETASDLAIEKSALDETFVLERLKTVYAECSKIVPILDRRGEPTGETQIANPAGANKALELMGKKLNMWQEQLNVSHFDQKLEGMTTDQLRAQVAASAAQVGLRVVDMNDDETRSFIYANAERLGLRVETVGGADGGTPPSEAGGVPPVSETGGVPPSRLQ